MPGILVIDVVTGTPSPESANLQKLSSLEHLIQHIVMDSRFAAINVLDEDLQRTFRQLRRKDDVDYRVGRLSRTGLEDGREVLMEGEVKWDGNKNPSEMELEMVSYVAA